MLKMSPKVVGSSPSNEFEWRRIGGGGANIINQLIFFSIWDFFVVYFVFIWDIKLLNGFAHLVFNHISSQFQTNKLSSLFFSVTLNFLGLELLLSKESICIQGWANSISEIEIYLIQMWRDILYWKTFHFVLFFQIEFVSSSTWSQHFNRFRWRQCLEKYCFY